MSFLTDLEDFLKLAEKKLEKKFNRCCEFASMHKVLMQYTGKMRAQVEAMRANATLLFASEELPNPLKPSTGKNISCI